MRCIKLALLFTVLLAFAGCVSKPQVETSEPGAMDRVLAGGLPLLPDDRETSSTNVSEVNGKDTFERSLNAVDDDTALELISGADDLSWGLWRFNPPLAAIVSIQVVMDVPDGEEAYIALSNYANGVWDFDGPLSAGKSVTPDDDEHRSAEGNLYLAVIAWGGDVPIVHKLVLTTDDGWVIVTVDSADNVGGFTSMALIDGRPAISYHDYTHGHLKYASSSTITGSDAGDWSAVTVDSSPDVGTYTSLALVEGQPAISYYDATNEALRYARRNPGPPVTWTLVTVDTNDFGTSVGKYNSLAVVNGKPFICYFDDTYDDLRHAVSLTTTGTNEEDWNTFITDSDGEVGRHCSLTVVDGKAAVSYYDQSGGRLKYRWFSNPAKVTVYGSGDAGSYASLAVVAGNPAISFHGSSSSALMYARSSTTLGTDGWDWNTICVHQEGNTGRHTSLAVVDGRPAISYQTLDAFGLWVNALMFSWASTATGTSPEDWDTIVLEVGLTGYYTSLLEVDGKPAISYHGGPANDLMYAIRMEP